MVGVVYHRGKAMFAATAMSRWLGSKISPNGVHILPHIVLRRSKFGHPPSLNPVTKGHSQYRYRVEGIGRGSQHIGPLRSGL